MADLEQWVNMARAQKWVEDDVTSIERLGPLHFECSFEKAQLASFQIKVEPTGSPVTYTSQEKGRNQRFKLRFGQGGHSNDGKKKIKLEQDVFLPAAGGNEFKIKAKYKNTVVEAKKTVAARRRLFYQSCPMQGITAVDMADMESEYWSKNDFYIKLCKKADGSMPLIKTLYRDDGSGGSNFDLLAQQAKTAWSLQARMPYAFMVVWANYLASAAQKDIRKTVDVKMPSKLWVWFWKGLSFEFNVGAYLWHGLDDAHDAAKHWLVSVEVKYRDKDGKITRLPIPDDRISLGGDPRHTHGGYTKIKVDLSAKDLAGIRNRYSKRKGKMRFCIKVRTVAGWMGGFALDLVNMIVVADKGHFQDNSEASKKYVLNHEVGHKIGMTADGSGRLPDAPASLYGNITSGVGENNKGHNGTHCETGGTYDGSAQTWSGTPGCVMFGSDCLVDGDVERWSPDTYCASCQPVVRKLDLSAGMPGFSHTPKDL